MIDKLQGEPLRKAAEIAKKYALDELAAHEAEQEILALIPTEAAQARHAPGRRVTYEESDRYSDGACPNCYGNEFHEKDCEFEMKDAAQVERDVKDAEAIPQGIYYCQEHENFYNASGQGMGEGFWEYWKSRRSYFPQWTVEVAASAKREG